MTTVMGRPRVHDREQIAKDMIAWSLLPDSINLNKFCGMKGINPPKITDWAREDENFRAAYEEAKANLGFRREEWLNSNKLHVKAYDLNAANYDHFLKDDRRQQAEYEAKLKSLENMKASEADIARHEDMMRALSNINKDCQKDTQ